jgi:hypothetical protein
MTAFDDHFDGTSDRWTAKVLTRLAHSVIWLLPVALAAQISHYIVPQHDWLRMVANALWLFMALTYITAHFHQLAPRLCVKCMQEVPKNASTQAAGFRRYFLRLSHFSKKESITGLCIVMALAFAPGLGNKLVTAVTSPTLDVMVAALVYGMWLHHRLRPWCPYCRDWGNGGEAELVPDPDPSESKVVR